MFLIDPIAGFLSGRLRGLEKRAGVRIFCYHGIVERKMDLRIERNFHLFSDFKEHLRFLRRFRILSLAELEEEVRLKKVKQTPAAVITFDDGYVNNLIAAEILQRFKIPWTAFVVTEAIGRMNAIWTMELSLLLFHGRAKEIRLLEKVWKLNGRETRAAAFQEIRMWIKGLAAEKKNEIMDSLRRQFPPQEIEYLLERFPFLQMLSWEEIRQLSESGVEIGSHGAHHEIHHDKQSEEIRKEELVRSKQQLEKNLQRPCRFFAFPNGNFMENSENELKMAGYELGFTSQSGTVKSADRSLLLPRLEPPSSLKSFVRQFFWEKRIS